MATAITNVRVFDGERMTQHNAVHIDSGTITAVGDMHPRPGDEVVDGRGGTLLPGLIDAHLHLLPGSAKQAITFGVTTVLDMFSKPDVVAGERAAAADADAADVRSSLVGATAPGGHPSMMYAPFPTLRGPSEAAAFVRSQVAMGAEHLKVFYDDGTSGGPLRLPSLDVATIAALADAGHEAGLVVVAHMTSAAGVRDLLGSGIDVLAHAPMEPLPQQTVEAIAVAQIAVIATLDIADGFPAPNQVPALLAQSELAHRLGQRWSQVLRRQVQRWMPPQLPDFSAAAQNIRRLYDYGVPVLVGTDAPNPGTVPGASVHRELQHLVAAGMSPIGALDATTSRVADVFKLADRGRIRPGLRADLVLVDGYPDKDIADSQRVQRVWKGGRRVGLDGYIGSPAEDESIAALAAQTEKVIAAVRELIPGLVPGAAPQERGGLSR